MERTTTVKSALATALALALTACGGGGGGGNVRIDTPPPPPPPTTRHRRRRRRQKPQEPAFDAHLSVQCVPHSAGLCGQNVRIGIVDSGVQRDARGTERAVVANLNYIDPSRNNLQVDDVVGHGTAVASLAAGAPVGSWPGGIALVRRSFRRGSSPTSRPPTMAAARAILQRDRVGVAQVHQDPISYNVKVMNNSWAPA